SPWAGSATGSRCGARRRWRPRRRASRSCGGGRRGTRGSRARPRPTARRSGRWGIAGFAYPILRGRHPLIGQSLRAPRIDVFSRTGRFERSLNLPYGMPAIGGDDVSGVNDLPAAYTVRQLAPRQILTGKDFGNYHTGLANDGPKVTASSPNGTVLA